MLTSAASTTDFNSGRKSKMKSTLVVSTILAAVALSTCAFGQGLPSTKVLTFDVAHSMAQAAMAKCHADSHKIAVVVVDSLDEPLVVLRDEGAAPGDIELAMMKAKTVILFRTSSGTAYPTVEQAPNLRTVVPGTWNTAGGVPINVGEYTIGAIAVAGGHGQGNDASCAEAGVAKVADKLK
jgi:uncharacterized protein GlcG (DUF336 family)